MKPDEPQTPNPYTATAVSDAENRRSSNRETAFDEHTVCTMRQTMPWVVFFSVVLFINCLLVLLGAFVAFSLLSLSDPLAIKTPGGPAVTLGVPALYVLLALLYFVPAALLWGYGMRIGDFVADPAVPRLNRALDAQRRFWRTAGIIVAALIGVFLLCLLVAALVLLGFV